MEKKTKTTKEEHKVKKAPVKSEKTSKPTKKEEKITTDKSGKYFEAVGRRKTSIARVRFFPNKNKGKEEILINEKALKDYFPIPKQRATVLEPFKALSLKDYYVSVRAMGGGITGQAEATRLGIARALILLNPIWRSRLKQLGYLKRDPRMVERKHPGLRKARRPQQWRKR